MIFVTIPKADFNFSSTFLGSFADVFRLYLSKVLSFGEDVKQNCDAKAHLNHTSNSMIIMYVSLLVLYLFQDEDGALSFHGVAFVNLAPLLYPGGNSSLLFIQDLFT